MLDVKIRCLVSLLAVGGGSGYHRCRAIEVALFEGANEYVCRNVADAAESRN